MYKFPSGAAVHKWLFSTWCIGTVGRWGVLGLTGSDRSTAKAHTTRLRLFFVVLLLSLAQYMRDCKHSLEDTTSVS